jgi:ubiquinone/menaquinone biosynthesis C-methylase UbiE
MLIRAAEKAEGYPFQSILADMSHLPFQDSSFDKVVSVTALEFIKDAKGALKELFRVTKKRGRIVVATLNSLSPWASRRKVQAKKGHALFKEAIFRSPEELKSLSPVECVIRTAIHFQKDEALDRVPEIEQQGQRRGLNTGAFLVALWEKP